MGACHRLADVKLRGLEEETASMGKSEAEAARTAWVTCEEIINGMTRVLATNIFQRDDNGKWWMVHHQGSMIVG